MKAEITGKDPRVNVRHPGIYLEESLAAWDKMGPFPRVGDFIQFADGVRHRVSAWWSSGPQTSAVGSWHLGDGFQSFSGGLDPVVPIATLTLTNEKALAPVWLFATESFPKAHSAFYASVPVRIYTCSLFSPVQLLPGAHEQRPNGNQIHQWHSCSVAVNAHDVRHDHGTTYHQRCRHAGCDKRRRRYIPDSPEEQPRTLGTSDDVSDLVNSFFSPSICPTCSEPWQTYINKGPTTSDSVDLYATCANDHHHPVILDLTP